MQRNALPTFLLFVTILFAGTSCAPAKETNTVTLLQILAEMCRAQPSLVEKGMVRTPIGVPATVPLTNFETLRTRIEGDSTVVQLLTPDMKIIKGMVIGPQIESNMSSATSKVNISVHGSSIEAQLPCY